jgi:hypothetical protein
MRRRVFDMVVTASFVLFVCLDAALAGGGPDAATNRMSQGSISSNHWPPTCDLVGGPSRDRTCDQGIMS